MKKTHFEITDTSVLLIETATGEALRACALEDTESVENAKNVLSNWLCFMEDPRWKHNAAGTRFTRPAELGK